MSKIGYEIILLKKSISQIVEEIVASEKSDIQLALIEYRDHEPRKKTKIPIRFWKIKFFINFFLEDHTFVTRTHDFTSSVKEMKGWLDACSAEGGGDTPEGKII